MVQEGREGQLRQVVTTDFSNVEDSRPSPEQLWWQEARPVRTGREGAEAEGVSGVTLQRSSLSRSSSVKALLEGRAVTEPDGEGLKVGRATRAA